MCKILDIRTKDDMFTMYTPVVIKSNDDDEKGWYVTGMASTADEDLQGDVVDPNGIDIQSWFLQHGWINYEHSQEAKAVIGEPVKSETYVDEAGLHLTAKLYKEKKLAQDMWELSQVLKAEGSDRRVGFSIEGAITGRDEANPKVITGVIIQNVSLTTHPANPNAQWSTFIKSMMTGYETNPEDKAGGAALRRNTIADAVTTLTWALSQRNADELLKGAESSLRATGLLNKSSQALMLQLGRGLSAEDANRAIIRLSSLEGG